MEQPKKEKKKSVIGEYILGTSSAKKRINETATRQDSLDTYNSSNERNKFYREQGYTEDVPKKFNKEKQNQTDIDEIAYKSVEFNKNKPKTNIIRKGITEKGYLNPTDYARQIDKHKYDQRDNITQDVNMDAPMGRKDSRIQPTSTITFRKGTDIASVEQYDKPSDKKKETSKTKKPVLIKVKKQITKKPDVEKEQSDILKKGSYFTKKSS